MRRQLSVIAGLVVVLAFAVFAKTNGPTGVQPTPATGTTSESRPGGGGLPLGAPQSGPPGAGYAAISGAIQARYDFTQISCIHSPNSATGLLAKGSTDPNSPDPVTIGVATDHSTLTPIQLRITGNRSFSADTPPPHIHRAGKTVTFTAHMRADSGEGRVTVRGALTCGTITTLG